MLGIWSEWWNGNSKLACRTIDHHRNPREILVRRNLEGSPVHTSVRRYLLHLLFLHRISTARMKIKARRANRAHVFSRFVTSFQERASNNILHKICNYSVPFLIYFFFPCGFRICNGLRKKPWEAGTCTCKTITKCDQDPCGLTWNPINVLVSLFDRKKIGSPLLSPRKINAPAD